MAGIVAIYLTRSWRTIASDLLATDGDLVMVEKLLRHATMVATTHDDRQREYAKKRAVDTLPVA